jgi:hypothetical protein
MLQVALAAPFWTGWDGWLAWPCCASWNEWPKLLFLLCLSSGVMRLLPHVFLGGLGRRRFDHAACLLPKIVFAVAACCFDGQF